MTGVATTCGGSVPVPPDTGLPPAAPPAPPESPPMAPPPAQEMESRVIA